MKGGGKKAMTTERKAGKGSMETTIMPQKVVAGQGKAVDRQWKVEERRWKISGIEATEKGSEM